MRVKNRVTLEALIETETTKRTTAEWLELLDESGMPYAAVNDIQGTLNHPHGKSWLLSYLRLGDVTDSYSSGPQHGQRNRAPRMRSHEAGQHAREVFILGAEHQNAAAAAGAAH